MKEIMDHWLFWLVVIFLLGMILYGHYRGLIHKILTVSSLIVGMVFACDGIVAEAYQSLLRDRKGTAESCGRSRGGARGSASGTAERTDRTASSSVPDERCTSGKQQL